MNMRTRRCAGDSTAKGSERDARLTEVIDERFAFPAVGMKRHVHGVAMIKTQPIVG
jgi:hypothetical protein